MNLFNNSLNWYKGNLHTHTSISDGALPLDKCIDLYKNNGYSFLSITDHRKFFKGYETKDFLLLSGMEFHLNNMLSRTAFHIVGIDINEEIYTDDDFTPQRIINEINKHGGIAIISHPAWSFLTHIDIMELRDYTGIEIWNTTSEVKVLRGSSENYIDVLASKGIITNIFAVDDTHLYDKDVFGGYVMVNCKDLKKDSIMDAIRKGSFYSSQGPEIKQITIDKGRISVECSPVKQIAFLSDIFFSAKDRIWSAKDGLIERGSYMINHMDNVVRIVCTDENGKRAWSQFVKRI